jgi:quinol monooxygenase YgiN
MKWPPVTEYLEFWKATPDLLSGEAEIWYSNEVGGFTKPELAEKENPYVVLAKITYKPEEYQNAVDGWMSMMDYAQTEEPGWFTFLLGKDVNHPNRATLVEAYESEEYVKDFHFKNEFVLKRLQDDTALRSEELDFVFLKLVAGYWHK